MESSSIGFDFLIGISIAIAAVFYLGAAILYKANGRLGRICALMFLCTGIEITIAIVADFHLSNPHIFTNIKSIGRCIQGLGSIVFILEMFNKRYRKH